MLSWGGLQTCWYRGIIAEVSWKHLREHLRIAGTFFSSNQSEKNITTTIVDRGKKKRKSCKVSFYEIFFFFYENQVSGTSPFDVNTCKWQRYFVEVSEIPPALPSDLSARPNTGFLVSLTGLLIIPSACPRPIKHIVYSARANRPAPTWRALADMFWPIY